MSSLRLDSPQKYWKYLRNLVNTNKKSDSIPILKSIANNEDILYNSDAEKAECLNHYFCSISNVDDSNCRLPIFASKTNCQLDSVVLTRNEIESMISTLCANKAAGPDLTSHKVIKNVKSSISLPLVKLFSKSLKDHVFPEIWKESIVNPLFKKDDKSLVCNYRPISLLSCIGKLMERCVHKHLYNDLYFNYLLYEKQSGFLSGH